MREGPFFGYIVAHRIASDLDREGKRPGLLLKAVVLVPAAIVVVGFAGLLIFGVGDFALSKAGIIH